MPRQRHASTDRSHAAASSAQAVEVPARVRAAEQRARRIVGRRAWVSAGAAAVPIPGLDIVVDVSMLVRMLSEVNAEFGLTPAQIEHLAPAGRLRVQQAIEALGASLIGRYLTRGLVMGVLRRTARQLVAKSALRFVPLAGPVVAASLSYGAIRYIGSRHIDDCIFVASTIEATPTLPGG